MNLNRKILFFEALLLIVNGLTAQTQLGLRALSSPQFVEYYEDLNAKASRQIRRDYELNNSGINQLGNELQSLKNIGITTIMCLRFPNHPSDIYQVDRVPLLDSADLTNSLALVDTLLVQLNGKLDYFQIQNEPLAGPGKFIDITNNLHYGYYAIQWLDTLAKQAKNTIERYNLDIEIISPAFHDVEKALKNTADTNLFTYIKAPGDTVLAGTVSLDFIERYWYRELMRISKSTCDILDIHLNVDSLATIQKMLIAMDSLQQIISEKTVILPYSTLEWSQTKEREALIKNNLWMINFLDSAYQYKVNIIDWYNFMDSINYDSNFMQDAYCLFNDYNFVHACYAGLLQFGNPGALPDQIFSTCALLTNKTCFPKNTGGYYPNEPFYTLYKSMTTCNPNKILEASFDKRKNILLYPNPANTSVSIKNNSGKDDVSSITVFNVTGQVILTEKNIESPEFILDISFLKKGIYILQLSQKQNTKTAKLVVN